MKEDIFNLPHLNNLWSIFHFNLGNIFYNENITRDSNGILNIVINVPYNYSTTLSIASGIAHAIYYNELDGEGNYNEINELERLKKIEVDTLVFYSNSKNAENEKSYSYKGISEEGIPILLDTSKNPVTLSIRNKESWRNIRIAPRQTTYKTNRTIGNDLSINHLYQFYDKEKITSTLNQSETHFLIAGNERQLREEANQLFNSSFKINDYIRIKKFGGNQNSFISDFFSNEREGITNIINVPTIIDGANNYLLHSEELLNTPKIIILSRENSMDLNLNAIEQIELELIKTDFFEENNIVNELLNFKPPANIELFCWRVKNG